MAGVSALDDVLAALVTIFQAAVGASVPVYDGLPVTAAADLQFVLVGDDGDANSDEPAAATTQERGTERMTLTTTEIGDVTCALICQTGDDDFPGLRSASRVLMTELEAAIRSNPNLGGVVTRSYITDVTLWQVRNPQGSAVRRVFTIHYDASQG